jgi:hypothetical protein
MQKLIHIFTIFLKKKKKSSIFYYKKKIEKI